MADSTSASGVALLLGLGKLLVEHRIGIAGGLSRGGEVLPAILELPVELIAMAQVVLMAP